MGAWLLAPAFEDSIVLPRCQIWPMSSETRTVPRWGGSDHTTSLFGGFTSVWIGEGKTGTDQKAKLEQLKLAAKKLLIYAAASNELLADGVGFEDQLGVAMRQAILFDLDEQVHQRHRRRLPARHARMDPRR